MPCDFNFSISENRISLSRDDSDDVGSSSAMTRASAMIALAISTICRAPMDRDATLSDGSMSMPISASFCLTTLIISRRLITPALPGKRPSQRFSATVNSGTSCNSW
ncbi:hypothetical protein D3C80_1897890 [compost metagenome]